MAARNYHPTGQSRASGDPTTNANWAVQTVTVKSADTEPSVLVAFDDAKYYFNVGENALRTFFQSRRGFKRLKAVFVTQVNTRTISGLPGLLMCIADAAARTLDIVGPRGVLHHLASMRAFMFRKTLSVNTIEAPVTLHSESDPEPLYQDGKVTIYAIACSPSSTSPTLKRKRSPSLDEPSKRVVTKAGSGYTSLESTASMDRDAFISSTLGSSEAQRGFDPALASPEEADKWRRTILDHMFTYREPPAASSSKKGKVGEEQPAVDPGLPQTPFWARNSSGKPLSERRTPAQDRQRLPKPVDVNCLRTLSYIVVGPCARGKFDVKRAEKLGLSGKNRGIVAGGGTVTIDVDDGNGGKMQRTICPEDVLFEPLPPSASFSVVMIIDIPTPDHIGSFLAGFEHPFYSSFRSQADEDVKRHTVRAVYHFLGKGVMDDPRYQNFVRGFADHIHHFISAPEYVSNPVTFTSAALSQLHLGQVDSKIFPPIKFNLQAQKSLSDIPSLPSNMHILQSNWSINVYPPKPPAPDTFTIRRDFFHPALAQGDAWYGSLPKETRARFEAAREAVRIGLSEYEARPAKPGDDLEVVFMGTSSAICSRYRNFSGLLLRIPDNRGYILMDPGEGTYGQLARFFGTDDSQPENVGHVLRNVHAIFVSHNHGDHHAGLAKILAMRKQLLPPPTRPLFLVANTTIQLYVREQSDLEDFGIVDNLDEYFRSEFAGSVVPILTEAVHVFSPWAVNPTNVIPWLDPARCLCEVLGLSSLTTVDVRHQCVAHGLILNGRQGWKFVYSGDTLPASRLIGAGQGATVLVHEATMADDLEDMARMKAHSTVGQAIGVGNQMRAQNIILTHFSTRYPKGLGNVVGQRSQGPQIAMALDHCRYRVRDLWKHSRYMAAIEQTIVNTAEEDDEEEERELMLANKYQ
ncbi:hypothetical protein K488DRAFT_39600 [Vararia minispora EC-137]|uniref:Uncharacterized protein n=1 Tax=Vararia minispora EC-137 TaxID=1314806 RepID=A0ACB8R071_9AGAM|nr:hypothetical protein K488DRAFT_39600 [Vararia minispora EC-137]